MKRFFLFILILTAFVSCGEKEKCGGNCKEWQQCNSETDECELKSQRCEDDCGWGSDFICNSNHICVYPDNLCENITCSEWQSCNKYTGMCELTEGRCSVNDDCSENKICNENNTCITDNCVENDIKTVSCGLNNNGIQNKKCVNQIWVNDGTCEDSDICKNGMSRKGTTPCNSNGGGFYQQDCINGQWIDALHCVGNQFITTWTTTEYDDTFKNVIYISISDEYTYKFNIDCNNDGIFEGKNINTNYLCVYDSPEVYQVAITGIFPVFEIEESSNKYEEKLLSVDQWGIIKWESFKNAFEGCTNLEILAIDTPDLSNVTDLSYMFSGIKSINESISLWNVSNITNISNMFRGIESFNQDLSSWDVSNVINMRSMFIDARLFNKAIGNWNTINVKYMDGMFQRAYSFNQPIGNWNVSNVTSMDSMFNSAYSFNQDLNNWDVSNVKEVSNMFENAISFNKNINSWKLNKVTYMYKMFYKAVSFNQDLNNWEVGNVKDMRNMFRDAVSFNKDISSWDVSNVTSMENMFYGSSSFNQDLSTWNVGNLTQCYNFYDYVYNWTLPKPNFTQCNPE